ncbi:hypothetical protein VSS74_22535 [Conexibacter stalactiti]|uniref:Uncharacterized protein n=1 Tax=Conexibacter stalactiti TaxID=1940611 RepID=A0ABU4HV13_9ACTN|nr:hypothetical protein [Conexibacter stalactiti]MDW5597141.1 hypothetical protein [Conexibacter stalactiti]MEC5037783.1 hypothetical protein [Conexibacter stalactiti]
MPSPSSRGGRLAACAAAVAAAAHGRPLTLLATALAAAAAAATPASATMLVYRDGDDVWAASPDGAIKQRVTTDGSASAYYSFPSVDDAGTITAIKGSSTNRMIWTLPRGAAQPTLNVMPWRGAGWPNIGPTWARVNASGSSLAYTYRLNYGPYSGYPNGGFDDRYAIVNPAAPGSPTAPAIDQPGQYNPTWFGSRLVTSKNGEIWFETQPLQFRSWLSDPAHAPLLAAEVNRAGTRVLVLRGDGRVVIAGWQGTVGSTAGAVTSQCLLPASGIGWAALSPDGTQVAWSDAGGLRVATVTASNATTCPTGGLVTLSASGVTPAFSTATLTPPVDPGRRDPTDPGRRDPTDPGRRDPADPGERDPADPGRDPTDPGRDPTDPGTDPADPGRDGTNPGRDPTPDPPQPTPPGPLDPGRPTITTATTLAVAVAPNGRANALRKALRATVSASGAGTLRATLTLRTAAAAGRRPRTLALGAARTTLTGAGRRTLVLRPAGAGARQITRGARLTLRVTFTPKSGAAAVRTATIAVR